jgi:hypothetical protein
MIMNRSCPLDDNYCLELLNPTDNTKGLEIHATTIETDPDPTGNRLLFHQAELSEFTDPQSPPWEVNAHSTKRLKFSHTSQESRIAKALPLVGYFEPINQKKYLWAVPLVDLVWPIAQQDLKVFLKYSDLDPVLIASSSRPIGHCLALGSGTSDYDIATLIIKNEMPWPVTIRSVQEAYIANIGIPQDVLALFGRRIAIHLSPSFGLESNALTLESGETFEITVEIPYVETGSFVAFVMITTNLNEVPGAASILVPIVIHSNIPF